MGDEQEVKNTPEGQTPDGQPIEVVEEEVKLGRSFLSTEYIPKSVPETFSLKIVDLDDVLFSGDARTTIIPTPLGEVAILPGHTPLYIQLLEGTILIEMDNGQNKEIQAKGGLARIVQNETVILVGFSGTLEEDEKNTETENVTTKNEGQK